MSPKVIEYGIDLYSGFYKNDSAVISSRQWDCLSHRSFRL
jgi:hypothetical protein